MLLLNCSYSSSLIERTLSAKANRYSPYLPPRILRPIINRKIKNVMANPMMKPGAKKIMVPIKAPIKIDFIIFFEMFVCKLFFFFRKANGGGFFFKLGFFFGFGGIHPASTEDF